MKFVRFQSEDRPVYGRVEENRVFQIEGDIFSDYRVVDKTLDLAEVKILPPCLPSKIMAIGLNYRTHAEELGMALPEVPLLFLKPPSAVIGHQDRIVCPDMSCRVDYEGELGAVIGRTCRFVTEAEALEYVLGYTCVNDVTARDLQKKDVQFTRAKSFDTFAPVGPFIETDLDPDNVTIETFLNGEKRQSGTTRDLVFPVRALVSFLSKIMTLCPGDVIATGTPKGVGPMAPGDTVEVKIDGIGTLLNRVKAGDGVSFA